MNLGIGLGLTNYLRVPTVALDPDAAIAALFQTGTPGVYYEGAWYDPSDSTTVFQDSTGTTPATVGDPVGLILDKSKGLTLGSELAINGTFDTDTGWAKGAGWTISGGVAQKAAGSANSYFSQNQGLTVGGWYKVEMDISGSQGVTDFVQLYDGVAVLASFVGANGHVSAIVQVRADYVMLRGVTPNVTITVDNFSVKELPGNHATQSTSAARPVLQQSGGLYYLDFDGVDDWMVVNYGSTLANITRAAGYRMDTVGRFFADDDGDVNYASMAILTDGNLRWGVNGAGSGNNIVGTGGWDIGADGVVVATASSGSALTLQGTGTSASGTSAPAPANITGATIGAAATGLLEMNGRIYGFIDIDRVLDAAEITSVETYLAAKSGVTL